MKFRWRDGSRVKGVDAETAAQRINTIRAKLGRDIRPEDILADAKSVKSPLHPAFEWDDTKAAQKYRLAQASHLLVSVELVTQDEHGNDTAPPVRGFVCVMREDEKKAYMPIVEAMNDPTIKRQVLKMAEAEAKAWAKRYRRYLEFATIVQAIETTIGDE